MVLSLDMKYTVHKTIQMEFLLEIILERIDQSDLAELIENPSADNSLPLTTKANSNLFQ